MSEDNQISAAITTENLGTLLTNLDANEALLPVVPDISDEALKRLLGVDQTTEFDDIAAEVMDAHPEWKPILVDLTEYAKDAKFLDDTSELETKAVAFARKITVQRRLAAHDRRRASLAIYHQVAELAGHGKIAAQPYFDRMAGFYPGRAPKTPTPPTPPTP